MAVGILIGIALGFFLARPAVARAPNPILDADYINGSLIIRDNAIIQPQISPIPEVVATNKRTIGNSNKVSGFHSTRMEKQVSAESLRIYLKSKGSPLAEFAEQISQSSYASTIIGICTIEQYGCTRAPGNNYWGLMGKTGLQKFPNMESGIAAIDSFLTKNEPNHPTIESMRGWYCASACTNWQPTVIKTKVEIESLN